MSSFTFLLTLHNSFSSNQVDKYSRVGGLTKRKKKRKKIKEEIGENSL